MAIKKKKTPQSQSNPILPLYLRFWYLYLCLSSFFFQTGNQCRRHSGQRATVALSELLVWPQQPRTDAKWQGQMWHIGSDTLPYHQSQAGGESHPPALVPSPRCRTTPRCSNEPRHHSDCCQVWACHGLLHWSAAPTAEGRALAAEGEGLRSTDHRDIWSQVNPIKETSFSSCLPSPGPHTWGPRSTCFLPSTSLHIVIAHLMQGLLIFHKHFMA